MWSLIVPVVYELLVVRKHPGFDGVGFVEGFNLSDRRWYAYACDDMFNPVSTAELRELRDASSCLIELRTTIRQNLIRLTVLPRGVLKELDGMICRGVMMNS